LLSKWPIRNKLLIGIGLLLVIVSALSWSGFYGGYAYRGLVRSLSGRADELPLAASLSGQVSNLRVAIAQVPEARGVQADHAGEREVDLERIEQDFAADLKTVRVTLDDYRDHLENNNPQDSLINDSRGEREIVLKIDASLDQIMRAAGEPGWLNDPVRLDTVHAALDRLQGLAGELPEALHQRIQSFHLEVRVQYRTFIITTWITTVLAAILLCLFIRLFYSWVFRPLRILIEGSRRVAAGEFGYRISLHTHDEMSELAHALNDMTARFEAICDGLDRQVQERTKQVVRSEQLASVGFLAAGVAHEINNPLASIALCAESLEGRIAEALINCRASASDQEVIRNYLRMIQDEAFRCKGITERLLDFSRMGDVAHQSTDLRELVQGVIDMVGHLGRYQDKRLEFAPGETIVAEVNAQEMKQVVLNLITNGLDSLSPGGLLRVELLGNGNQVEMIFTDDGCGMTDEVLKHLFEPFFTRRRCGQGTGLGLSITYRIVADHGGHIDAHSDGPGKGSQFRVSLPRAETKKELQHRYQAA
jgi:two-component system, NtrC family, sensor kinase